MTWDRHSLLVCFVFSFLTGHCQWEVDQKHQNNKDSPLFTWAKADIRDAIDRLRKVSEHASSQTKYPVTMLDLPLWMYPILTIVVPFLFSSSLVLLGENSIGKTSMAMTLAFAFPRCHLRSQGSNGGQASVRTTEDLSFLKSKVGTTEEPVVFDDGDLWSLRRSLSKQFLLSQCSDCDSDGKNSAPEITQRSVCDRLWSTSLIGCDRLMKKSA